MSQDPTISNFLNGKPIIAPVGPSSLLTRLQSFLPQMEEANRNMPENASADAFHIENVEDDSSDDSDSNSESISEEVPVTTDEKSTASSTQRIEIDLDVFKEMNSAVDDRDVGIQNVEALPEAFQSKGEDSKPEITKKPLIEEL